MPKSDWLDALAFRKMEEIHAVCSLSWFSEGYLYSMVITGRNREIEKFVSVY